MNNYTKQYNRYFISSNDFQATEKYLKKFKQESDDTIKEALLIAAIISYNRPFTKNDSGYFIISNITNFIKDLSCEQKTLHNKLVNLRNKALAHSTWDFNQLCLDTEGIVTMNEFYILHQRIDIEEFLALSNFMAVECESKSIDLKKMIN